MVLVGSECDGGFVHSEFDASSASRHAFKIQSCFFRRNALRVDVELDASVKSRKFIFYCLKMKTWRYILTRAGVTKDERVLVTGASGGVGSAAVQLARVRGAHVAAVTSPSKSDALRNLGADRILFREDNLIEAMGARQILPAAKSTLRDRSGCRRPVASVSGGVAAWRAVCRGRRHCRPYRTIGCQDAVPERP